MYSLLKNIRFYILFTTLFLSLAIYLWARSVYIDGDLLLIKLTEIYGFLSIGYLYFAILVSPLIYVFPNLPLKTYYLKARRAVGVSAFYFGLLHSLNGLFNQFGGFAGLRFLSGGYLLSVICGFAGLLFLTVMAATSFDFIVAKLTFKKWKLVHRFVYLAVILVLVHVLVLGTHFADLSGLPALVLFLSLVLLLVLESVRYDKYLREKKAISTQIGPSLALVVIVTTAAATYLLSLGNNLPAIGVHALHIQLARQAQQGLYPVNLSSQVASLPGLSGDRTRRFTVSFLHTDHIEASADANLTFQVFDASSGNRVGLFSRVWEKPMHLVILDSSLTYFSHIHPEQNQSGFSITTQFPRNGEYHLYLDFQPLGAIEQQFAFTLDVGKVDKPALSTQPIDSDLVKVFGNYQVSLSFSSPLKSSDLSVGNQKLTFRLSNLKSGEPVTNLKPYLAAFGHLVMIDQDSYNYIHVHPTNLVAPSPADSSGPTVEFLPIGLYGLIKPGIYRIFAQFNPDNQLMVSDFTVRVE